MLDADISLAHTDELVSFAPAVFYTICFSNPVYLLYSDYVCVGRFRICGAY